MISAPLRLALACGLLAVAAQPGLQAAATDDSHAAALAAEVRRATGVEAGLAVVWPAQDAALLAELTNRGQMLVYGVCPDDAQVAALRSALLARGLGGLATVERAGDPPRLPFAERTVNLLIVDLDAAGERGPTAAEFARVLAPGGAARLKHRGAWNTTRAAWPAGLDDWTHFAYGPQGNAVSHDRLAGPTTSLRWIAGVRGPDLRIARGMLFSPLVERIAWHQSQTGELRGRDAFNGLLRWSCPTGLSHADRPNQWAANGKLVFHFPHHQPCHAVATDARTGQTVRTFDQGVRWPEADELGHGRAPRVAVQLVCGATLVQGYGRVVTALRIADGRPLWRHECPADIAFLSADADARQVFVHEVSDPARGRARWGKHTTVAVACIEGGKTAWRNTELAGQEISDLVYCDGAVYAFDPVTNLGDDGDADVWKLSARDGRILWQAAPLKGNYNISLNSLLVRDGQALSWGPFNNLRGYDAATGRNALDLPLNQYNQRCTRLSATDDWLIFGLSSWVDRQGNWTQTAVGRSDCALPAYPAHGQVCFGSNVTCTCINPLRGIVALGPAAPLELLPDAERLERPAAGAAVGAAPLPPALPLAPPGPIAREWRPDPLTFYFLDAATPPLRHGDLTLTANADQHLLTAARGEKAAWNFVAGGRVYAPPLLLDGRCYVAAADGYVYCLDAATGRLLWRFCAAATARKVVAYGQLESAWPVYNVVAHDGAVCVAAGRHAELDGGIFLWGLDPASGGIRWKATLFTPPRVVPAGQKPQKMEPAFHRDAASRSALNGGLQSVGGRLQLRSPFFDKRGSSPSATGYFLRPGPERGEFSFQTLDVDPAAWNGRTINPRDLVELPKKK
jgi:outer membrane protein assembly factor BamB